jgi:hypothetical protein
MFWERYIEFHFTASTFLRLHPIFYIYIFLTYLRAVSCIRYIALIVNNELKDVDEIAHSAF